jgi:hypothetical protein
MPIDIRQLENCFHVTNTQLRIHVLKWEDTELTQERDERLGKQTARYLAPAISSFIRKKFREEPDGMGQDDEAREVAEDSGHGCWTKCGANGAMRR